MDTAGGESIFVQNPQMPGTLVKDKQQSLTNMDIIG
jgi:hypothetical protein